MLDQTVSREWDEQAYERLQAMGPTKIACPCEDERCGMFGVLNKRTEHVRSCRCRRCQGGRNRQSGLRKQREARKALGIKNQRHGLDANEEAWRGAWRVEVKSGKQVGAAAQFFRAEAQAEAARASGDVRPFAYVQMPEGMGSEGFVTVRLSDWRVHISPRFDD